MGFENPKIELEFIPIFFDLFLYAFKGLGFKSSGITGKLIRSFDKYWRAHKYDQQKKRNPERWTLNLWTAT